MLSMGQNETGTKGGGANRTAITTRLERLQQHGRDTGAAIVALVKCTYVCLYMHYVRQRQQSLEEEASWRQHSLNRTKYTAVPTTIIT